MKNRIYLDHNSTTPLDPEVLKSMMPYFTDRFGNPASRQHRFGWEAEAGVELARKEIAETIGAKPNEIYFTSGATLSNNLVLAGALKQALLNGKNHFISCVTEHSSVLEPLLNLEKEKKIQLTLVPVDRQGQIDLEAFMKAFTPQTFLVSVMAANNEIGTVPPLEKLTEITRQNGALFHTDAAQIIGRGSFNVQECKVDFVSLSAHKIHGPKGVGALYIREKNPRIKLEPLVFGGGHEEGIHPGTLNVPAIVGMGRAYRIAKENFSGEIKQLLKLKQKLFSLLKEKIEGVELNGEFERSLPNTLNVTIQNVSAVHLMREVPEVAFSSGSACASLKPGESHVLREIGRSQKEAKCSVRFGLGRFTTEEEIEEACLRITKKVEKIRSLA